MPPRRAFPPIPAGTAGPGPAPGLGTRLDARKGRTLARRRGANSDLLSPQTTAQMRARRPDMTFAEVPDRGHVPFLDEPEALHAIAAWLKACQ